jgi:LysM repeat protein
MKKLSLPILFCLLFACNATFGQTSQVVRDYIARFRDIAIAEMQRTGVPASITLAQGILETEAGKSPLVIKSNNHFGIKCKSDWRGEYVTHDDDAKGECFRKYNDPAESYKDHSDFLKNRPHYAPLFKLSVTDYEAWAYGLKKAGYATNPKYPQLLIKLIRDYDLQQYTMMALVQKPVQVNITDSVMSVPAENAVAKNKTDSSNTEQPVKEPTGSFASSLYILHTVQPKETVYAISKKYGVSIESILQSNQLTTTDLKAGQQLRINKN